MKKIKIILVVALFGGVVWILSGGVSASREKIVPQLWNAVSKDDTSVKDSDKDGLTDAEETKLGTDPKNPDTDGDHFLDGQEVKSGYDPLKPAPGDRTLANANGNSNSNTNANTNNNANSNSNSDPRNPAPILAGASTSSGNSSSPSQSGPISNVTEQVAQKVDDLISKYNLYQTPYSSLDEATKAELDKDLNSFSANIVSNTGLNFSFNVPNEVIRVNDSESNDKDQYIGRAKDILRKHNLIDENQTIETGIREMVTELSGMSKNDIDWDKVNNWKREAPLAYQELNEMPINSQFKNAHIRLLRVIKSLDIVFGNINEGDYFRAFLAAGRADKVGAELDKFTQEIK